MCISRELRIRKILRNVEIRLHIFERFIASHFTPFSAIRVVSHVKLAAMFSAVSETLRTESSGIATPFNS